MNQICDFKSEKKPKLTDKMLPSNRKRKREEEQHYEMIIEESQTNETENGRITMTTFYPTKEVSSPSNSQLFISENINGNEFANLKYEIISEEPRKYKLTVTGVLEEIKKWQEDILTGRCYAARYHISPAVVVRKAIENVKSEVDIFNYHRRAKRFRRLGQYAHCCSCGYDFVDGKSTRRHIAKSHTGRIEEAIISMLPEQAKFSKELFLYLMQVFYISLF
jgi:hypothetical protein